MITVSEVLQLPEVALGAPRVVAGSGGLGREVRWVHVAEVADIAGLLKGGELILTTGIALPDEPAALDRYVEELSGAGARGLVVELGRHFSRLPRSMAEAAERRGLPLVELAREVRYVEVTQAVHSRIVNAQFEQLERAREVHEVFTQLSLDGASAAEIVAAVADLAGRPALLESLSHQLLAYAGPGVERFLTGWERRSRAIPFPEAGAVTGADGWLASRVAVRGEQWGRLVLVTDGPATPTQVLVVERGASALALERLVERDRESLERQVHRGLLAELLEHGDAGARAVALRAQAVGVPLEGRTLVGVVVRHTGEAGGSLLASQLRDRRLAELAARAARRASVPALVGTPRAGQVWLLASFEPRRDHRAALSLLAREVRAAFEVASPGDLVVAAGLAVRRPEEARRSLEEAIQVASAASVASAAQGRAGRAAGTASGASAGSGGDYVELPDVRVRGLLYLLRDDPRLQSFVERELGPLLARDAEEPEGRLVEALEALCRNGGNVAAAAKSFGLSRAAYYHRLARVEEVLGTRLAPVESLLSSHLALLALATIRAESQRGETATRNADSAASAANPGLMTPLMSASRSSKG